MSDPIRYTQAVGRRKTATARVKLTPAAETSVKVNGMTGDEYFKTSTRRAIPVDPLNLEGIDGTFAIEAKVSGGGVTAQAEAIRMGVARAITLTDANLRAPLKAAGFLKRDPRAVERKKPGLLKARKSPAWSKR
ncbi:MAG: ribosomal protein [Parcubacteria group bacterium]|jgi:small subunit ribosomal protein S9|nr:ribosomal protein [Parcubacteria group bacterium]